MSPSDKRGRPKKLGDDPRLLFLRLPKELLEKIDQAADAMTAHSPWGLPVSRSDAARVMLAHASTLCAFYPGREADVSQGFTLESDQPEPNAAQAQALAGLPKRKHPAAAKKKPPTKRKPA
jgi:hypothetical protein